MKNFLILFSFCAACQGADFEKFVSALGKVESGGNPKAYNKAEDAKGIFQIRKAYFADAVEFSPGLRKYKHDDCFDPAIAREIIKAYFNRYGKKDLQTLNFEGLAKLHNGGPGFKNKTGQAKKNLDIYAGKINKELTK